MTPVSRATVVTHGVTRNVDEAAARLEAVAREAGVELLDGVGSEGEPIPELAVVLGGDGTMLRALTRFLGSGVPVIGANFGRVGFLTAIPGAELESGIARVFAGEYTVVSLPTLEIELDGARHAAVNDAVIVSGAPGRIVEISYSLDGEDLGTQPCDGLLVATPPGSTAYNLSNGGPVLVWGLEAAVLTFVAPHTLHARPLVVGPEFELEVVNRTFDVEAVVLVDGHSVGSLATDAGVRLRFGTSRTLLATLPEQTFFRRYAQVFGID
ncbi:MAG TPA: NAD(+)/NADH kinase [Gaiellaceae bacterium]|nr:NAD(+)/NADH kinase [Gaiellaceae bacterium]